MLEHSLNKEEDKDEKSVGAEHEIICCGEEKGATSTFENIIKEGVAKIVIKIQDLEEQPCEETSDLGNMGGNSNTIVSQVKMPNDFAEEVFLTPLLSWTGARVKEDYVQVRSHKLAAPSLRLDTVTKERNKATCLKIECVEGHNNYDDSGKQKVLTFADDNFSCLW